MRTTLMDRRGFLASAGVAFVSALQPRTAQALNRADAVFASAYRAEDGTFGVAMLTEQGDLLETYPLPARGHDIVPRPEHSEIIVFARRPGIFAVAVELQNRRTPTVFQCANDRHFYGHGCFSVDGRLLYSTENDFEGARGIIGIYDATNGYKKVGEIPSGGVGPHDLQLLPDGRTLVVANGGVETHPDFPRAKLNLASMEPNLVLIDARTGDLLTKVSLPADQRKLSIRHLAMQADGTVWFACQNQGDPSAALPLAGSMDRYGNVTMLRLGESAWAKLRGYVGSIACSQNGERVILTSPRGGVALDIDTMRQFVSEVHFESDVCGAAINGERMFLTSGAGKAGSYIHPIGFDNHVFVASSTQ
ncbi:MAG: DUF1513 domain-containing protein [Pseudomonadota bacterium]